MKKLAICLTLAGAMLSSVAHAQVTIDMGFVFVDLLAYTRNVVNVKSWCASNPTQTVMAGLQRATDR